jgi:hypothetical protein
VRRRVRRVVYVTVCKVRLAVGRKLCEGGAEIMCRGGGFGEDPGTAHGEASSAPYAEDTGINPEHSVTVSRSIPVSAE